MEKVFITLVKEGVYPKVDQIREAYDQKFNELVRRFWEEIDKQTTVEKKSFG